MAKAGHDGLVGLNLLATLKRYTLPCLYGAMLAGVDIAFIGAGILLEEARQIPKLAAGEPASLRLVDEKGRLLGRCPAEPVDDYLRKGGDEADTEGRGCLCNALMANVGHAQHRDNYTELPLYTGGDALETLPLGSVSDSDYSAVDVIDYLYGDTPSLTSAMEASAAVS
jgi:hypothetical protein